uniref:Uncharacterized protein n=1 Tax=Streptomyces sp. FR1 TaxID=349971 RepID=V9Z458_9ACTN|nr:hypothetical protein [Streptomyces sp. FR1]AHE38784.1 Hypothetical protein pFRL3_7c [Streptomyces sp. FR1]
MSVTFTAAHVSSSAFIVSCCCPAAKDAAVPHATYEAACAAYPAEPYLVELPGCEYPGRCRPFVIGLDPAGDVPKVNLANANACRVLGVLGLADELGDLTGRVAAEDFRDRCLIALALEPADAGVPAVQDGRIIDCGRPAGYLQDRLAELHDLAVWCAAQGRAVSWA